MAKCVYEAPPASFMGNVISVLSLLFFFGSVLFSPLIIGLFVYLLFANPFLWSTICALLFSTLWIAQGPSEVFRRNFVFGHWRSYFSLKVVREDALIPEKGSMMCIFPHGVFPLGLILTGGCVENIFPEHSIGAKREIMIASVFFKIPVLSALLVWLGCVPVSTKNILTSLDDGSCLIFPEGIAGVFLTSRKTESVYLKKRRGFIRMAMQAGARLVPVYMFGQSHLLDVLPGAGSYLERISRKIRVSLMFFFGSYYFPIPRSVPITIAIGSPIACEKNANPSPEEVDVVHTQFSQALVKLFDDNKGEFGWGHKTLELV
jgi:2-acylglycerol O-acyltransferase 2